LGKGEGAQAKQSLIEAVELNPRLLGARLILARIYLRQGEILLAREQTEEALKQYPEDLKALSLQGALKIQEKDLQGAEAVYKRVVELAPDYVPGHVQLGLLYNLSKRQEDALRSFKKAIELDPLQINALRLIVGVHLKNRTFDEALKICDEHKKRIGDHPYMLALIEDLKGRVYLAQGVTDKAKEHFEKAIEIEPNILAPYQALARIYVKDKNFEQAIAKYEAMVDKNPKFLQGYMALGIIYDHQGEKEKAESYYRKALEIKSDFAPAAHHLAWNLAKREIKIDEALSLARLAKEKSPGDPYVMDTLGWIYYLNGRRVKIVAI